MAKELTTEKDENLLKYNDYYRIVEFLRDQDDVVTQDLIAESLEMPLHRIKAVLKFGRRNLKVNGKGLISIEDYIIGCGNGCFLATNWRALIAYVVQNTKRINSEIRTIKPLYKLVNERYPDELKKRLEENGYGSDEDDYWAVFNSVYRECLPLEK